MKSDLLELIRYFFNHEDIFLSWGISTVRLTEDRIHFAVNGFRFSGTVDITHNSNSFSLTMKNKDLKTKAALSTCSEVLEYLDSTIETSDGYLNDIVQWLGRYGKL